MSTSVNNPYLALTLFKTSESALLVELESLQVLRKASGTRLGAGRGVLREVHHTGTRNGVAFNMEMLMELAPAD